MNHDNFAFEIAETALALRRAFDGRAARLGVTRAQWRVLGRLNKSPGLKQVELAEWLDVEPITLCRQIDRLEEAGLVVRARDPDDRRAWRLQLTPAARPIIDRLKEVAAEFAGEAFGGIDPADEARIRASLERIRQNCAATALGNRASA